jgi:hypothetical protein
MSGFLDVTLVFGPVTASVLDKNLAESCPDQLELRQPSEHQQQVSMMIHGRSRVAREVPTRCLRKVFRAYKLVGERADRDDIPEWQLPEEIIVVLEPLTLPNSYELTVKSFVASVVRVNNVL